MDTPLTRALDILLSPGFLDDIATDTPPIDTRAEVVHRRHTHERQIEQKELARLADQEDPNFGRF